MDNNKNEQCCFNTNTHGEAGRLELIGTGCIAKAVSAAKYQNQFNNNNLIEQENLMPPAKEHSAPDGMVGADGAVGGVASDLHNKQEKVFTVNGCSRNVSAILSSSSSSSSSSVSGARNTSEERVPSSGQQIVACLTTTNTTNTSTIITNATASFTPTINGTATGYSRPASTTIAESLPRSGNVDQSLDSSSPNVVGVVACDQRNTVEQTLEASVKLKTEDATPAGAPDDGDFSDNNSIGNLSYISENGLIEEIILLPNNAYSDDDNVSTSDDCIYAYRGGEPGGAAGLLLELRGDQPPDDETDFLEMDFDPEPSSEMENFDTSQQEQVLGDEEKEQNGLAVASASAARLNDTPHLTEAGLCNGIRTSCAVAHQVSPDLQRPKETELTSQVPQSSAITGSPSSVDHVPDAMRAISSPGSASVAVPPAECTEGSESALSADVPDSGGGTRNDTDDGRSQAHKTGAIPKAIPHQYAAPERARTGPGGRCSSNAKNLKLDLGLCLTNTGRGDDHADAKRRYLDHLLYYEPAGTFSSHGAPWAGDKLVTSDHPEDTLANEEFEFYCSECGNLEFTSKLWMGPDDPDCWICRNCAFVRSEKLARCRVDSFPRQREDEKSQRGPPSPTRAEAEALDLRAEQIAMEALSKINSLKEMPPTSGRLSWKEEQQQQQHRSRMGSKVRAKEQRDRPDDQQVPTPDYYHHGVSVCPENTVTIYTINCGELTIIESLTRIGIAPNLDVLRQYFTEQYEVDTSKMNIPQYLLHMSKRDCNYKKLIEAIKCCCDDETLDVQYYPFDPFTDMPEIVQISSCEIAKRWNANTNLRQIIHFKHKHFHTLNVLGKIVNIIRQPSRGRHTNHMIGIPQYYKSGSITITRPIGPT